jgi:hypothetical protein
VTANSHQLSTSFDRGFGKLSNKSKKLTPSKANKNSVLILRLLSCSPSFLSHNKESISSENVESYEIESQVYIIVPKEGKEKRWRPRSSRGSLGLEASNERKKSKLSFCYQ